MRERPKDKNRLEHMRHALDVIDFLKSGKYYQECEKDVANLLCSYKEFRNNWRSSL